MHDNQNKVHAKCIAFYLALFSSIGIKIVIDSPQLETIID